MFIGRATADTLLAGPGTVEFGGGAGHFYRAGDARIQGQVIRVDRISGPAVADLPAGVREVVVVPWDYDSACQPLPWGGSAQWVTPGATGLYIAKLRPAEHWVGGRPTFDLDNPGNLPYTATRRIRGMGRDTAVASLLSPQQVFEFYDALPTLAQIQSDHGRSLEALRAWVRSHPEIVSRPPAAGILQWVLEEVSEAELRRVEHPVLGTWRISVRLPGDSTYTYYARTVARPTKRWMPYSPTVPTGVLLPPAEGYVIAGTVAPDLESLPTSYRRDRPYIQEMVSVIAETNSSGGWDGLFGSQLIENASRSDRRVSRAASEVWDRFGRPLTDGVPVVPPAEFFLGGDGILRVRQRIRLQSDGELIVEGEQVSREVLQGPM